MAPPERSIASRLLLAPLLIAAGVVAASPGAATAGEALKATAGSWAGRVTEITSGLTDPDQVQAVITPDGGGFRADLKLGRLGSYQARFGETARPGVYESIADGMFSMFSTKPPPNPLQGGNLAWAREEGGTLILYRLDLPNGRMRLDRLALERIGDSIEFRLVQRDGVGMPERLIATLSRRGAAP